MRKKLLVIVGLAVLSLGAAKDNKGCGGTEDDETMGSDIAQLTEDAGDSNGAADAATSVVSIVALPLSDANKVATAAAAVAAATAGTGAFFQPSGCLTATANGTIVTYEFKSCTGPFGLVAVNGKVTATFTAETGGVSAAVKSDGLKINNTAIDQSATVSITFAGSVRTVKWSGQYQGITYYGKKSITHQASYTTDYDTSTKCVKWNGSGSTSLDSRTVAVTVSNYHRCGEYWYCPKSGTITATNQKTGLSISIQYLGSGKARVTGPKGNSWDYKMLWCLAN